MIFPKRTFILAMQTMLSAQQHLDKSNFFFLPLAGYDSIYGCFCNSNQFRVCQIPYFKWDFEEKIVYNDRPYSFYLFLYPEAIETLIE